MSRELAYLNTLPELLETLPGHLGIYYKNPASGEEFDYHAGEAFLAASVIKLPLFCHILTRMAEGTLSPELRLKAEPADMLPSCGALRLFTDGVEADLLTLCRLMIALSDNTATNMLIRLCTMEDANRGFDRMGLHTTRLRRLLFDAQASAAGLENTISPREMGALLEEILLERFVSPDMSRLALSVLGMQQINHKLGLCGLARASHKTGEDDGLSNDTAIVHTPSPFILCMTGHDTDVYRWEEHMRRICRELALLQLG